MIAAREFEGSLGGTLLVPTCDKYQRRMCWWWASESRMASACSR